MNACVNLSTPTPIQTSHPAHPHPPVPPVSEAFQTPKSSLRLEEELPVRNRSARFLLLVSGFAVIAACTQVTPAPTPPPAPPETSSNRLVLFPSTALLEAGRVRSSRCASSRRRDATSDLPILPRRRSSIPTLVSRRAGWALGACSSKHPHRTARGRSESNPATQTCNRVWHPPRSPRHCPGAIYDPALIRPEFERVRVSDPGDPANPLLPFTPEEYVDAYLLSLTDAPHFPMRAPSSLAARLVPGQIVIGLNAFGRVAGVVATRDGQVLLSVQQIMPDEAFSAYQRNVNLKPLFDTGLLNLNGSRRATPGVARAQSWKPECKPVLKGNLPGGGDEIPGEDSPLWKKILNAFSFSLDAFSFNPQEFTFDLETGPKMVLNTGLKASASLKPFTGKLGVKCEIKVFGRQIPMPGLLGLVIAARFDVNPEFSLTLSADADIMSFRSELSVDLVYELSAGDFMKRRSGDGFKLNVDAQFATGMTEIEGPSAKLETKAEAFAAARFMIYTDPAGLGALLDLMNRWPGFASIIQNRLDKLLGPGLKASCASFAKFAEGCLGNVQLNVGPFSEFSITAYSLNRAWLENKRSGASLKPLSLKLEAKADGYLAKKLKFLADKAKYEKTFPILEEHEGKTPINTLAQTEEDKAGKAKLKFEWVEAEVSQVHLGVRSDVVNGRNSLHAQKTASGGGPVTYKPSECPKDGSGLKADVAILGELKLLGISLGKNWPMSADRKVRVCNTPNKLSAQPVVVRDLVKQSGTFVFSVKNHGLERSPYWVKTSPPKGMKLEDSQGELEASASKDLNGSYTCPDKPGAWEGHALLRDFSGNVTQEQRIPLILICQGSTDVWGDPHLITLDGLGYSFQGKGEFVLLNAPNAPRSGAFESVHPQWPVTFPTRVATRIGGAVVEVAPGPVVRGRYTLHTLVDGQAVDEALEGVGYVRLPNGGLVARLEGVVNGLGRNPLAVVLTWPSSDPQADTFAVVIRADASPGIASLQISPSPTPAMTGLTSGLLGNFDAQVGNDLAKRDGSVLPQPLTFERLYGEFAREWAVRSTERLFTDAAQPHDPNFPPPGSVLSDDARIRAEGVCAGITDAFLRGACVNDVGFTSDNSFADVASRIAAERQTLELPVIPIACLEGDKALRAQRLNCVAIQPARR
ncbi:MAG: hypothetical protein HC933_11900 [Pleurocapsa sp. SU_196_0]|nr:hypothetical protein [Pleurocapsa sp. SU_196_0]